MTDWVKVTKDFIWENKEGAIIGGLLGWFVIVPLITKDTQSIVALQSSGLIDMAKSASTTATTFAIAKARWFAVAVGIVLGTFVDAMIPEGFFNRWFK